MPGTPSPATNMSGGGGVLFVVVADQSPATADDFLTAMTGVVEPMAK